MLNSINIAHSSVGSSYRRGGGGEMPPTPLCQRFAAPWTKISKFTQLVNLAARRTLDILFARNATKLKYAICS